MAQNNLYPTTSPYNLTNVTNSKFLDVMVNRSIPYNPLDVFWEITVVYQYRPDLLAYDLYSDVNLWWVFAVRNKDTMRDPVFDLVAGTKIYLPKLSVIKQALSI